MKYNKLRSLTFWLTIWAMLLITYTVIADRKDFVQIAICLCAMPLAYTAKSAYTKKIYKEGEKTNDIHTDTDA